MLQVPGLDVVFINHIGKITANIEHPTSMPMRRPHTRGGIDEQHVRSLRNRIEKKDYLILILCPKLFI